MSGIFDTIKGVLTYKPKETRTFELIESSSEGVERENTPEAVNIKIDGTNQENNSKQSKSKKTPLSVEEWNNQKNEEAVSPAKAQNGKVSSDLNSNLEVVKKNLAYRIILM